jgi:hypothetical protein
MKKSSLIRSFDDKKELDSRRVMTNRLVKKHLVDKYELSSLGDVTEFSVSEENGIFERGVYQIRPFGLGDIVVKVLRKTKQRAWEYHEEIKNTHLSWQQDSVLSQYILKVRLKSRKPDYDESSGLLFVEFEKARETLAQKIRKRDQYTEEERVRDFQDLVKAVTYLHRRGDEMGRNFHGDLKPDNIFIVEYQNVDGQLVDCLKIGDIEESLGTLPYRDFSITPYQGWEDGDLSPTGKKDDVMALKMIFLEIAYDFTLFDFCKNLLKQGTPGLEKFLEKNASARTYLIEQELGEQKYLRNITAGEVIKCNSVEEINRFTVLFESEKSKEKDEYKLDEAIDSTQIGEVKKSRLWEHLKDSYLISGKFVFGLLFFVCALLLVNSETFKMLPFYDMGIKFYLASVPFRQITDSMGFFASTAGIFLSWLTFTAVLSALIKDKKNVKIKYLIGDIVYILAVVIWFSLAALLVNIAGNKKEVFFETYSHFSMKHQVKDGQIPAVKINLDKICRESEASCDFSGVYENDRYQIKVKLAGRMIEPKNLSPDFIVVNGELFERLFEFKLSKINASYGFERIRVFKDQVNRYEIFTRNREVVDDQEFKKFINKVDPDPEVQDILVFFYYLDTKWGSAGAELKEKMLKSIERNQ